MKKLSILLSLLALNGCSYFDNVWSCIQYADTHKNDVIDYLEFHEYDFTNGITASFSASNLEIDSETQGKKDLDEKLYLALLEGKSDSGFKNPLTFNLLREIEEDALYIRFKEENVFGGLSEEDRLYKDRPSGDTGTMYSTFGAFECKKTRVSGWGMELHFPDTFNFEL